MERNQREQRLRSLAGMNEVLPDMHLVASPATTVRDWLRVMGVQLEPVRLQLSPVARQAASIGTTCMRMGQPSSASMSG